MAIHRLADKGWRLAQKIGTYIPFTSWYVVWSKLDKGAQSILDIGCADGDMMKFIGNRKKFYTIGIDIHRPYLEKAKRRKSHSENVLCDVRKLPFREKSFDIVLCLETLEHLERKDEGIEVIQVMEEIARRQVIISTPVGLSEQPAYGENPDQEHHLSWRPSELNRLGYHIRGVGILENWLTRKARGSLVRFADNRMKRIQEVSEKAESMSYALKFIDFLLRLPYYLLLGPLVYFLPRFAGHMICTKQLKA